jgi:hypothetical protein
MFEQSILRNKNDRRKWTTGVAIVAEPAEVDTEIDVTFALST